jgi:xylulose-5-phosphate/fructose-6-phosphate phosphoketolase
MDEAVVHATKGIGIWEWAGTERAGVAEEPDVVMGCAGDVPTMEALAAVDLLRHDFPDLKVRFVNVVDLMRLQDEREHPHGLSGPDFDALFTRDKPVIFAYHGYPWLIHRLTYKRTNHDNFHVRGYKEEGTTTTPFDMTVLNQLDRFNLAMDVIDRVPRLQATSGSARERLKNKLIEHRVYVRSHGEDMPEIRDWQWSADPGPRVETDQPSRNAPEA